MLKFTDFLFIIIFLVISAWVFFWYVVPHIAK